MVPRAVSCLVAAWLLTASVFVSSRSFVQGNAPPSSALRGQEGSVVGNELKFQRFQEEKLSSGASAKASHWASVASVAAAFGLVLGMMSIPARAEEAAAPVADAAPAAEQPTPKKKKLAQRKEQERERRALVKPKKSAADAGPTFGSSSAPSSNNAAAMKTSAGRIYYNASDQLADDEISFDAWLLKNPIPFLALILGPSFVYLGFFVAGSLNII
eukprot:CAMPEP_0170591910 /NCGR_PEP_ID=MMETSP0224-20130122/12655_1 /TAXON_ID=285029 /ORGANISM="Togula jolla, Strain CCCM 725" /LENGTH=214 /DNA_ID=CAMNT_0010915805 /DNA_START=66 /DNA_END=710 /DNA_ORIENTATION=+